MCKPFTRWKDAIEVFEAHGNSEYHKTSVMMADNFMTIAAGENVDVLSKLDAERVRQMKENRARLFPIIKTIIFCGRQELALRGTDERGCVLQPDESSNDGNFRALLRLRVEAGDSVLKEHLLRMRSTSVRPSRMKSLEFVDKLSRMNWSRESTRLNILLFWLTKQQT